MAPVKGEGEYESPQHKQEARENERQDGYRRADKITNVVTDENLDDDGEAKQLGIQRKPRVDDATNGRH